MVLQFSQLSNSLPKKLSKIRFEFYPKQRYAFECLANEQLFGGASEGGKSYYGRIATSIWSASVPNLQTRIFRKHYRDVLSLMNGPTSYPELLKPWIKDKFCWVTESSVEFDHGALILLSGIQHKKDLEKHMGDEKHVLWVDESTQILADFIKGLRAWVRMPREMKDKLVEQLRHLYPQHKPEELREFFPRILYTTNPIGVSVGYFRRGFVEPRAPLKIGAAPENDGGFTRIYIPSRIEDNPSADPVAQRKRLSALGEAQAEALIKGLWDQPTGDFFKEYNDDLHSVDDFTVPSHWFKFRTFDWGSQDPFAVYWFAVSDGEEFVDDSGNTRWFPRGALIIYREWFGCVEDDPSKGLHMRNEDIAKGIVSRTLEATCGLTFSDNFPFADRGAVKNGVKYTMADEFFDNGCPLTLGNTARVYGWKQMRSRLQGIEGVPMLYVQKQCIYARDYIPTLPHHDTKAEDAAESGESTHSCDAIRLGCALKPFVEEAPKTELPRARGVSTITPRDLIKRSQQKKRRARTR